MRKFSESEFLKALQAKIVPSLACPICGSNQFTTYPKFTSMPVQENFGCAEFGFYMPCGILMCKNCGHIDLFSLAALGIDPVNSESGEQDE